MEVRIPKKGQERPFVRVVELNNEVMRKEIKSSSQFAEVHQSFRPRGSISLNPPENAALPLKPNEAK